MFKRLTLVALCVVAIAPTFAGEARSVETVSHVAPPVTITFDGAISTDAPRVPHAETVMAINPRDQGNILAASFAIEHGQLVTVAYYTKDGGRTWHRALLPTLTGVNVPYTIDPEVAFTDTGVGYFMAELEGAFVVFATKDGGVAWSGPYKHEYLSGYDRSFAIGGRGPFSGRLFVSGSSGYRLNSEECGADTTGSSDDEGVTLTHLWVWSVLDSDGCAELEALRGVSRSDGALFFFANSLLSPRPGSYYITASFNGGNSLEPQHKITDFVDDESNTATFDPAIGNTALDESASPYHKRLYLIYPTYQGHRFAINVTHSMADWAHWSRPISIDDDTGSHNNAIPQIAVNRDGIVAAIWSDKRNSSDNQCYQLGMAVSADGGATFSRNVLRRGLTCAADSRNAGYGITGVNRYGASYNWLIMPSREVNSKWTNGGDTAGLAAKADGSFGAVWANGAQNGTQQLWYTEFRASGAFARIGAHGPNAVVAPAVHGVRDSEPTPPLDTKVTNRVPVFSGLQMELGKADYDRATRIMWVQVLLKNTWKKPIRGPFVLTFTRKSVYATRWQAHVVTLGADNGLHGNGANWRFTPCDGGNVLQSGATTCVRTIRWKLQSAAGGTMTFALSR